MLIKVKVIPGSDHNRVIEKKNNEFVVCVREEARANKANGAVCLLLSSHFGVTPGKVKIIKGGRKRRKIIDIGLKNL